MRSPDPDHVGRQVVVVAVLVAAGERGLVLEQERLVAGVELDAVRRPELVEVDADGRHEGDGAVDLAGDLLVALAGRRALDEVLVPQVYGTQVGVAAGRERAHQVERRGRGVVGAQQSTGVGGAGLEGAGQVVDRVAAVGRQLHAVDLLDAARAGLGVLPGDAADLDHGHAGAVGQDRSHLQQGLDLVADLVVGGRHEGLGAVAALQQERLASRDAGQPGPQRVALGGHHQGRQRGQLSRDRSELGEVGPRRLLGDGQRAPVRPAGRGRHGSGQLGVRQHSHAVQRTRPRRPATRHYRPSGRPDRTTVEIRRPKTSYP